MQGSISEGAAGERELMLSQGEVLANPIKGNQKAQLYGLRSGGTVLKNYVKWCVDRNDPRCRRILRSRWSA